MSFENSPFFETRWKIRRETNAPKPDPFENPLNTTLNEMVFKALMHHPGEQAEPFEPLSHGDVFKVVKSGNALTVDFETAETNNSKVIWDQGSGVFYDPYFYAVRGTLNYDKSSGDPGSNMPHHFLIQYEGEDGIGRKTVSMKFFNNDSKLTPTGRLGHAGPVSTIHKGSWHADETGN